MIHQTVMMTILKLLQYRNSVHCT